MVQAPRGGRREAPYERFIDCRRKDGSRPAGCMSVAALIAIMSREAGDGAVAGSQAGRG